LGLVGIWETKEVYSEEEVPWEMVEEEAGEVLWIGVNTLREGVLELLH
jgi:hypothetical protein